LVATFGVPRWRRNLDELAKLAYVTCERLSFLEQPIEERHRLADEAPLATRTHNRVEEHGGLVF
jgi:hypothetical protein